MIANVGVNKNSNESTPGVIRRFTKRTQEAGIVRHVRTNRYYKRPASKYTKKKDTLKKLIKREHYRELIKLGKIPDRKKRGERRPR